MLPPRPHAATTPTSWTSEGVRRGLPLVAAALFLALALDADAGRRTRPDPEVPVEAPAPKPKTKSVALFATPLPLGVGAPPDGLANTSAQGCAACHVTAHAGWSAGAHANGWRDPAFREAAARIGSPACTSCHLPLLTQAPELVTFDGDDVNQPVRAPNPAFDASMRLEGVTCAACHVREGKVVATRPPEEIGKAPHPLVWSEDLTRSEGCAACHQLTWPGADAPLYDTFGEWQRSAYAKAGVQCQDCHGSGPGGFDHGTPRGAERAVSLLFDLDRLELVRGADPVPLTLTLQNTGAGHAFPTGSPFSGVALRAWLEGPPDKKGVPARSTPFVANLERTLGAEAPWLTTEDTRLPPGGTRTWETTLALPQDAADGAWSLKIELAETSRGVVTDHVLLARELPLDVH